ncbi:MAG TPA: hypothetical protein VIK72_16455 [Clostridiaceae bacterium]
MNIDLENIIENITQAKTEKEMSKALKDCLSLLEGKNPDKRILISALKERLINISWVNRMDAQFSNKEGNLRNVHIHDYMNSPVDYTSNRLIRINKIKDYKIRLRQIIDFFDNELEPARTMGLKKEQVYKAFLFLQARFRIFDIITCKSELEIYMFNNSHKSYNSFCEVLCDVNKPETYHNMNILSFASRAEEHNPYQVLIHEIGHALHTVLTHQASVIPESFIEMNKILEVKLENNTIETADVFADIFSVVVMNNSYLAEYNSLIEFFSSKVLELFEYYFDLLIKHALEDLEKLKEEKVDIIWEG